MILRSLLDWVTRSKESKLPRHLADSSIQTTEYEGYARYVYPTRYLNSASAIRQGKVYYIKIVKETEYRGKTELQSRHKVHLLDNPLPLYYVVEKDWRAEWIPVELCHPYQSFALAC